MAVSPSVFARMCRPFSTRYIEQEEIVTLETKTRHIRQVVAKTANAHMHEFANQRVAMCLAVGLPISPGIIEHCNSFA